MSQHVAFRRQAVDPQAAQQVQVTTIPAPTRGLILNENEAYMAPGAALICDNWMPTMKGAKLRGGCIRWCVLPETTPVISMFRFASGGVEKLFAGNATKLYDVTANTPTLVKSGQASGNYVASQLANQGGDHMLVANEAGDYLLHFDGTTWTTFNASQIHTDPALTPPPTCSAGHNLTYVWKYRNRYFFIEGGTMNAWYLSTNAYQGQLGMIPLAGSTTRGGRLIFGATWSVDAGDGLDDKCVFVTDLGEVLIFTGSDPSTLDNWRQEGRYDVSPPMGMNAHTLVGGDLLIMTVDGIVPISGAITKDRAELELAAITRPIKPMWRDEVNKKRQWAWTIKKWDEFGGIFVTWPGGNPGNQYCAAVNSATGAWCRFVGYDAVCFGQIRADMFFGTQGGIIMQMDRTGYDDGKPYTATLVGGWEMFQSGAATVTWRQARASFASGHGQPFEPHLSATTDYVINLPTPPNAAPDPGVPDLWDEGTYGPDMGGPPPPVPTPPQRDQYAQWDQDSDFKVVRNTMWVSIGMTGVSHAPIVQVTVAQQARPDVELIAISATYERGGVNV